MKTLTLVLDGMHCTGCAQTIKALLDLEPGVRQSAVSFEDRNARVLFDPGATDEARLASAIEKAGFKVTDRRP
ncbi:MAG: heavy-metal-associated domain-containing protein [Rhodospirillales bacterium]|nr:heavy-metal-associated domain-containing protein [Rhodospirillales bacterium]